MQFHNFPPFVPGFPPPLGKTRYVYRTPDSSCPNNGAPPSGPRPMSLSSPMPPWGPPPPYSYHFNAANASQHMMSFPGGPPAYSPTNPGSAYHYYHPPPFVPTPPNPVQPSYQPNPTGPVHQPFQATRQKKPPPKGCRVQGELPVYPGGKPPVIHSQKLCTVHLIKVAPGQQGPWNADGKPNMQAPACNNYEFRPYRVPTNLTVREFLEGIEIEKEYPPNWPADYLGVAEALEDGTGRCMRGSAFHLGDDWDKLNQTLEQVGWTADHGEAGQKPPVVLFLQP